MAKGTGNRLTDAQRDEIRNAGPEVTLAELAKRYQTSVNTIHRYRNGAKKAAQPKAAATKAPVVATTNYTNTVIKAILGLGIGRDEKLKMIGSIVNS